MTRVSDVERTFSTTERIGAQAVPIAACAWKECGPTPRQSSVRALGDADIAPTGMTPCRCPLCQALLRLAQSAARNRRQRLDETSCPARSIQPVKRRAS